MHEPNREAETAASGTLDDLVLDLRALRISAGAVTYDELVARIVEARIAAGRAPHAARLARSTVYDAFRTGRKRINPSLLVEIVRALGQDEHAAAAWRTRALDAMNEAAPATGTVPTVAVEPSDPRRPSRSFSVAVMLTCLGLNLFGAAVVWNLDLALYLDMIGTAVTAVVLGPWYGVLVGVTTNTLMTLSITPASALFIGVQVAGALVFGYGVRGLGLGKGPLRYTALAVLAGTVCTVVAAPVIVLFFDGRTRHASDGVFAQFQSVSEGLWAAVFSANLILSISDKLLCAAVALLAAVLLPRTAGPQLIGRAPTLWIGRAAPPADGRGTHLRRRRTTPPPE